MSRTAAPRVPTPLLLTSISGLAKHVPLSLVEMAITCKCTTRPTARPRAQRASKLTPFTATLDAWLDQGQWNAVVLLEKLRGHGYTGGYILVKNDVHPSVRRGHIRGH